MTTTAKLVAIWRYPVKSMMGEELVAADVGGNGLVGDRAYALLDAETGKVASAKNPKAWPGLFDFRATYPDPPREGKALPGRDYPAGRFAARHGQPRRRSAALRGRRPPGPPGLDVARRGPHRRLLARL